MDYENKYLMYLASCGIENKTPDFPEENINWESLVLSAKKQAVIYLVALAVKKGSNLPVPENIKQELYSLLFGYGIKNKKAIKNSLIILNKMNDAGIPVLLLKGYSVGRLYYAPECRESADTDIFVPEENEREALDFLISSGFTVTPRSPEMHHSRCFHRIYGLFEVHISLWEEYLDDLMFDSAVKSSSLIRNTVKIQTPEGDFYTIGEYETLLFLTFHLMKHFINGGIDLRMIADVSLYYRYAAHKIDLTGYWSLIEKAGFKRTVSAVLNCAVKYFGFSSRELPGIPVNSEEDTETVITDTLEKGTHGKIQDDEHERNWRIYRNEKQRRKYGKTGYKKFYLKSLAIYLFPSYKEMTKQNAALKKHRWMYPAYLIIYVIKTILHKTESMFSRKKKISGNEAENGDERIDILRRLDIL